MQACVNCWTNCAERVGRFKIPTTIKKINLAVTPLGLCNASVIWLSLLSNLDISIIIISMGIKRNKNDCFPDGMA